MLSCTIESLIVTGFDEKTKKATFKKVSEDRVFNSIKTANKEIRENDTLISATVKNGKTFYIDEDFAKQVCNDIANYFAETLTDEQRKEVYAIAETALKNACILER